MLICIQSEVFFLLKISDYLADSLGDPRLGTHCSYKVNIYMYTRYINWKKNLHVRLPRPERIREILDDIRPRLRGDDIFLLMLLLMPAMLGTDAIILKLGAVNEAWIFEPCRLKRVLRVFLSFLPYFPNVHYVKSNLWKFYYKAF